MTWVKFLRSMASVAIGASLIVGLVWWLGQPVDQPVLVIEAAKDIPDIGLPVYAQFVVTQTLNVTDLVLATKLVVPIYFPADTGERLVIELWRYETLVSRWRYRPREVGQVELVDLPIDPPQLVDGEMAVRFSASGIPHLEKDGAPRLFIETADQYYRAGNYFIADNAKAGDISLSLYGQKNHEEILRNQWRDNPLATSSFLLRWAAFALLIGTLPHVIGRSEPHSRRSEQERYRAPYQYEDSEPD